MIRIAQQGRTRDSIAETLDDVIVGLGVWWVEIDGVRIPSVVSASLRMSDDELSVPEFTVRLVGPVEIVYLGRDGNELGAATLPEPITTLDVAAGTLIDWPT